MSNSRNTGFLTNVIKVDATGNVSFVSGSTTLATISTSGQMSGSLPALSSSYALSASYVTNAETLDGLDSTVFTLTSSFNTTSASLYTVSSSAYATSGSLSATSGSFNTRVSALEATGSALSSSILSVSASSYLTSGSLSSASGSFDTRISTVESKYATTGSNTFIGTQIISGSILQSGSFTSTGTLTAQTLVVQTITSSVVYSSGSNVFGNSLGNSQVFTGSVLITGSLTISTGGNASAPTIFGSTIACSPIGCFATSCATSFIGGTMSGTTIYGSTAVCSPVGKFTTCIDAGSGMFSGGITSNVVNGYGLIFNRASVTNYNGIALQTASVVKWYIGMRENLSSDNYIIYNQGLATDSLTIAASTGAATFSSTITGTTIYGSTAVCSAVGYFSGCVGIGTINPGTKLEVYRCETDRATVTRLLTLNNNSVANPYDGFGMGILFKGTDYSNAVQCYGAIDAVMEFSNRSTPQPDTGFCARMAFSTGTNGALTERMRITSAGNVGIGTCSPSAKLHINGSTGASTYKGFAYTYAGSETLINEVLFQAVVGGYSSNLPIFLFKDERSDQGTTQRIFEIQGGRSGVGTILTTLASGNVGIGTCSPSYLLDVRSSVSSGAPIVGNFQTAGGDAQLYVSNGSVTTQLTADNTNSISIVGSYTNHPLVIRTNNTERVRVSTAGVTTVKGDAGSLIQQAVTAGSELYFQLWNSAGSRRGYIGYGSNNTAILDFWNAENGDIKFGNNNTEKWRIASTGRFYNSNITANNYALEVNGSTTTSQSYGIIIYAGTNSSDDGLRVLNTSGTEYFKVRGNGIVTKPLQPAFSAGKNTNSTVSAGATVIFQQTTGTKFNIGGYYDASTGIFTAPVAGVYIFSASLIYMNVPNGQAMDDSFWIYKNSDIAAYGLRRAEYELGYTGNGGYFVDFANVLLSLAVGDTVKVVNNRALEIHGNTNYSYFYGYLLG